MISDASASGGNPRGPARNQEPGIRAVSGSPDGSERHLREEEIRPPLVRIRAKSFTVLVSLQERRGEERPTAGS